MSLRNRVTSEVRRAFKLIGDLAIDVTFTPHNITGFDFATKSADETVSVPANAVIKAVLIKATKKSKSKNTRQTQLLLKSEDLPNGINSYDTVTIGTDIWKVGKPIEDNDYIILVEIMKEGGYG